MKTPVLIELPVPLAPPPAQTLAAGLLATPAAIAPKYFYDALGSRLFEAITELDEYYPTRTEAAILERHGSAIFGGLRAGIPLVELGAGSCRKAERVLQWTQPSSFVAVEIAASFAREGLERLQERFPDLDLMAVGTDFSQHLLLPPALTSGPLNLFYPGSSIGNFDPAGALALLRSAAQACAGGALVIGVDTVKDGAVLDAAYDDALGVTAAFNLNVLRHVNRLLGSDFDPGDWQHRAFYAAGRRRIEMHLEARHALSVRWPGGSRAFAAGERIHTEDSYKWPPQDFIELLHTAGFVAVEQWTDAAGWFAVYRATTASR